MGTITVNRTELGKALDFASLGLSKRPVVPVLGGILVTVEPHALFLAAFDYETCATVRVDGQAGGTGRVLVDGRELAAVIKSLPKGAKVTAEITAEDDGLIVLCDGIEAVLSSLPIDEYPQLPGMPGESGLADAEAFARTVKRVALCASTDDTLPVLTHVKVTSDGGMLEFAATDRYRLAVDRVTWTGPDGADALIPAVTLAKFAAKADKHGKVSLHLGEGFAGLSDGLRTLITRTSDREFPNHKNLMRNPDANNTNVLVDAPSLKTAVERAGKMAERGFGIDLHVSGDGITVTASKDGAQVTKQHVDAAVDGPDVRYGFNPGYLASVLAGFGGDAWMGFQVYAGQDEDEREKQRPVQVTADGGAFTALCCHIRRP